MNANEKVKAIILLIDDETLALEELRSALEPAGYQVRGCTTADEALRVATQLVPDLVISDINLGQQSGLELCEQIKQRDELADLPLIFLSGAHIPNVIRRAHAAGGTYYLRKPFDPEVLLDLVERALWLPHLVQSRLQTT